MLSSVAAPLTSARDLTASPSADKQSPDALKKTAQQFESVFMQMMLKNMRQAGTPLESGIAESNGSRTFRDMYDQQMADQMAKHSVFGIADMLLGQFDNTKKTEAAPEGKHLDDYRLISQPRAFAPSTPSNATVDSSKIDNANKTSASDHSSAVSATGHKHRPFNDAKSFFRELLPHAKAAAAELGVDPKLLLAQAALETGWGKSTPRRSDGSESHNLFGIKANAAWNGDRAPARTVEFKEGVAVRKVDHFRAYGSYAESFHDYVDTLRANPRYTQALAHAESPHHYVSALQKAGYASDPHYADKVMSIYRHHREDEVSNTLADAQTTPEATKTPAGV